jgi:hypothetical protein
MGGGLVKTVRWVLLAVGALAVGATAGFAVSLLRPRKYAEFTGVRDGADDGAGLAP